MGRINWGRVFVCGLLTGVVGLVFGLLIFTVWGSDFVAAMLTLGRPIALPKTGWQIFSIIVLNLVLGIVTIWLYAAIRPRYGPGPKTAAVAGFAMFLILSLADAFFMTLGLLPVKVLLAPMYAALVGIVAATEVGAWLYKE